MYIDCWRLSKFISIMMATLAKHEIVYLSKTAEVNPQLFSYIVKTINPGQTCLAN